MRSHRKQHFFVAILICIAGSSAMAGVNRWTNSGPEGAVVNALIAAPGNDSKLFALTWNGIFESTNGGGHWTRIDSTPSGVVRLAIRPDTGSLYAVASGSSLFRSDDGGEQWTELTSPVSAPLRNIAFSPDGRVMYAISPPSLFSSTDDGRSWTASDITDPALASLAVLPDGTVLAGGGGLHVSTDGGRTFTLTAITPTQRPFVSAIAGDSQNIYLGTPLGVMKSSDKAVTWTLLPPYPVHGSVCGCRVNEIAMTSDGFVAATDGGVFSYSSDGWKQIGTAFDDVDVSSVIVTASSIVAGSSAGVSVIGPNDGDWTSANAGLLGAETFDVTFDPTSSSSLYSASNSGIFVREGTNPWKLLHAIPQANAVAVAQQDPHAIFAASVAGVEKSPDNGKSWKLVTPSGLATRLAISPADPSTIYASLVSGLMKSTDGGETFKTVSGLPFDYYGFYSPGLAVDPLSASNAFVGTDYGIYRTQLGGTSWLRVTTRYADAFAIDPANPSVIYAGTVNAQEWDATQLGGLLKSIDGGLTWNASGLDGQTIAALAIDPKNSSTIYAATGDGRVHRSTNGGQSWTFFDSGLNGASIYKMAVDPTGTHLALATSTGVYEYQRDLSYLSGAVTYTIALRAQSDNYVSAASCGDSYVDANSTQAGGCETFTLYDVNGGDLRDGDKVYLQAANGSFVSAENGGANGCAGCDGAVNANRIVAASWETFTIHRMDGSGAIGDGTPISLQSSAGNFLVAESGGHNACSCDSRILANRAVAAAWETFVLELR